MSGIHQEWVNKEDSWTHLGKISVKTLQASTSISHISLNEGKGHPSSNNYLQKQLQPFWNPFWAQLYPPGTEGLVTENMISFSGLQRMLKAYSNNSFSDPESQKSTAALMEEVNIGRAQFPRFNDERVIFRTLVFQPIWPLFAFPFSWQNNLVWGV